MVVATLLLNPHPRLRRECGARKFNGVRLGGAEGCTIRPGLLRGLARCCGRAALEIWCAAQSEWGCVIR